MGGSSIANQQGVYGTLHVPAPGNIPGSRFGAVSWTDSSGNFWLFGGLGYDSNGSQGALNDLWKYSNGEWSWESGSKIVNQDGVYGNQGVPAPGNVPGSRNWSVGWTDSSGDLWLFGGVGYAITGQDGCLNDLWKFSNGEWTWMSGSNLINQNGVYGSIGMPAPGNIPGARLFMSRWTDANGNLWLIGGFGAAAGTEGDLSDLWMYLP